MNPISAPEAEVEIEAELETAEATFEDDDFPKEDEDQFLHSNTAEPFIKNEERCSSTTICVFARHGMAVTLSDPHGSYATQMFLKGDMPKVDVELCLRLEKDLRGNRDTHLEESEED